MVARATAAHERPLRRSPGARLRQRVGAADHGRGGTPTSACGQRRRYGLRSLRPRVHPAPSHRQILLAAVLSARLPATQETPMILTERFLLPPDTAHPMALTAQTPTQTRR